VESCHNLPILSTICCPIVVAAVVPSLFAVIIIAMALSSSSLTSRCLLAAGGGKASRHSLVSDPAVRRHRYPRCFYRSVVVVLVAIRQSLPIALKSPVDHENAGRGNSIQIAITRRGADLGQEND
jgi:hypothetical protein